jgi:uncharacterized membrane protein HdeD (DUF308 family)
MSNSPTQTFVFYGDGASANASVIKAIRASLVFGAIIAAAVAGVIFSWPGMTLAIIAVVFGIYVLIRGVIQFVTGAFAPGVTSSGRVLSIILGVLLIAASIFMLRNVENSLTVLGLLIGLSWILDGIAIVIAASRDRSRGISVIAGIVSIVAGIVFLFIPSDGVAFLTYFAGAVFVLLSVLQVIGAILVGKARG